MARRPSLVVALAADLHANTGTTGLVNGLRAFLLVPGFRVIATHRLAQYLAARSWRRSAELLWHHNVRRSGCHMHLDAEIAPGLKLPHPVGIVVGIGTRIGPNVALYQGVTLGRADDRDGYPLIEGGVTVFPNSVVVGAVRIGAGSRIGALSFVNCDVAPGATVVGAPARQIARGA